MSVLRVYTPAECDSAGVPLDWRRCRACFGTGAQEGAEKLTVVPIERVLCAACRGHGSLKAAALDELLRPAFVIDSYGPTWEMGADGAMHQTSPGWKVAPEHVEHALAQRREARCEDCWHPMSDGTWEPGAPENLLEEIAAGRDYFWRNVADGGFVFDAYRHYSRCDEGCRHDGPWREVTDMLPHEFADEDVKRIGGVANAIRMNGLMLESSWRPVDVRTLSWAHDLRPEQLAVLCLRCWAARSAA